MYAIIASLNAQKVYVKAVDVFKAKIHFDKEPFYFTSLMEATPTYLWMRNYYIPVTLKKFTPTFNKVQDVSR